MRQRGGLGSRQHPSDACRQPGGAGGSSVAMKGWVSTDTSPSGHGSGGLISGVRPSPGTLALVDGDRPGGWRSDRPTPTVLRMRRYRCGSPSGKSPAPVRLPSSPMDQAPSANLPTIAPTMRSHPWPTGMSHVPRKQKAHTCMLGRAARRSCPTPIGPVTEWDILSSGPH
jgi:hypothetical protein